MAEAGSTRPAIRVYRFSFVWGAVIFVAVQLLGIWGPLPQLADDIGLLGAVLLAGWAGYEAGRTGARGWTAGLGAGLSFALPLVFLRLVVPVDTATLRTAVLHGYLTLNEAVYVVSAGGRLAQAVYDLVLILLFGLLAGLAGGFAGRRRRVPPADRAGR
ncbi:membrane protein of unknown function [Candidatus Hydrogenisulfobacillus filiaventi]|uniref:Uncharacterized protein n=1 Tax=Candidatus Hydrogenisulfobacillus filiaventi TaxID=2707344 RepID=A0A6F8ZDN9_9FIRM|nr:hypothetical protein [Bacillota bacterium]CAB1127562.1 membrane protein of unknown function [Candidatus Hydrogenisulfobacillus filiaventi]